MLLILSIFLLRRELNSELAQLPIIDVARRLGHEIEHAVGLWEGDDFADAFFARDQHHDPVEAERDAAVRRSPESEGTENVAEERFLIFFGDAERGEDLRLQIALVNSNAAAAEFHAV